MNVSQEIIALSYPPDRPTPAGFDFYLEWPANTPNIATIPGQRRFYTDGSIEAWYTRRQLELAMINTEDAIAWSKQPRPELKGA